MIEAVSTAGWVAVAKVADVPPGSLKAVRCAGDRVVAMVNLDGVLSALDNTCPHRGGPLAGGKLMDGELACPWHGFRFDPRTGAPTMPTSHPPASVVEVRVAGDDVQIRL